MSYFSQCPECGETNHHQRGMYGNRYVECGFQSDHIGNRTAKCDRKRKGTSNAQKRQQPLPDDSAARYRLALLDAAQVVDTVAADMHAAAQSREFVNRLRELATQMRSFAGHSAGATFDDLSARTQKPPSSALMTILRRATGRRQQRDT